VSEFKTLPIFARVGFTLSVHNTPLLSLYLHFFREAFQSVSCLRIASRYSLAFRFRSSSLSHSSRIGLCWSSHSVRVVVNSVILSSLADSPFLIFKSFIFLSNQNNISDTLFFFSISAKLSRISINLLIFVAYFDPLAFSSPLLTALSSLPLSILSFLPSSILSFSSLIFFACSSHAFLNFSSPLLPLA